MGYNIFTIHSSNFLLEQMNICCLWDRHYLIEKQLIHKTLYMPTCRSFMTSNEIISMQFYSSLGWHLWFEILSVKGFPSTASSVDKNCLENLLTVNWCLDVILYFKPLIFAQNMKTTDKYMKRSKRVMFSLNVNT